MKIEFKKVMLSVALSVAFLGMMTSTAFAMPAAPEGMCEEALSIDDEEKDISVVRDNIDKKYNLIEGNDLNSTGGSDDEDNVRSAGAYDEETEEAETEKEAEITEYCYDYIWPLPGIGRITSSFGKRVCPYHGDEYHNAIDIAAVEGTPILACEKGVVIIAKNSDSYGNYVRIDHENGMETQYAHCVSLAVSEGEVVEKGQVIAYVGMTGNATGNHLDLRFILNGNYVNPLDVVSPE